MRFPKNRPLNSIIIERYGREGSKIFRQYENVDRKCKKVICDINFLKCCLTNKLTPKFLQFKLYSKSLENGSDYKRIQKQLLIKEIETKRVLDEVLCDERSIYYDNLKQVCSYIDFNHIVSHVNLVNEKKINRIKDKQDHKLFNLGLTHRYDDIDPNKVIFNYSDKVLTRDQKEALSMGLKFCFLPSKLKYSTFFASFEQLLFKLSKHDIYEIFPDALNSFNSQLKSIAFRNFYSFKPQVSNYHKKIISCLKELSRDKNVIITKPDKGNGVVLLNKSSYLEKMNTILADTINFSKMKEDLYKTIIKLEDKNNRLVDKLYKNKIIDEPISKQLKSSGSRPGILYGLPKVHKVGVPMRPILSTVGSVSYNMSQWLVPKLSSLCVNEYSVRNSFEFAKEMMDRDDTGCVMASFDISSLFTNIPIKETSNIILQKLFPQQNSEFDGFDRETFSKVLDNCLTNNVFLFNEELFIQKDGAPMGGCVSPTLANVFLCHHESNWLDGCPVEFKPVLYRRYVDDIFILFRSESHIEPFFQYINTRHTRINFTVEKEKDDSLSFLDVLIKKLDNKFTTDIYRKPTFSGQCLRFDSSVNEQYKINLVSCLLDRAFKICSSYSILCTEISRLRKIFYQNCYPNSLFEISVKNRFESYFSPKPPITTVPKDSIFCKIPFIDPKRNFLLKREISDLISKFYPQIDLNVIFENSLSIGSFFRYKDIIPKLVRSYVVYKYSCAQCSATYVGESTRHLQTRICEHENISHRTANPY